MPGTATPDNDVVAIANTPATPASLFLLNLQQRVQTAFGNALERIGVSAERAADFTYGDPYEVFSADQQKNLGIELEETLGKMAQRLNAELFGDAPKDEADVANAAEPVADAKSDEWLAEIYKLNEYIKAELGQAPGIVGVQEVMDCKIESREEYIKAINALLRLSVPGYDGNSMVSARDGARAIIAKNQDDLSPRQLQEQAIKLGLHGAAYHTYIGEGAWNQAKKHLNNSKEQLEWLELFRSSRTGIQNLNEAAHTR
ncbi:MAG: hypothetical protein LW855_05175 [Alphaproteobacteria bacterium]|jgi:hypothetical protein|nr:hypothetical protein [Alphaproteobacteria bacterium]